MSSQSFPTKRSLNLVDLRRREQAFEEYDAILEEYKQTFEERWRKNVLANQNSIGAKLNDFQKIRTIGTGAFGRVMLVRFKFDGTFYAMKIIDKAKLIRMKQLDHTYNEKRILQSMRFPFVIYLEFCFKDSSYIYMILPFITGGEMFTHLTKKTKFDEPLSRFYAAQVVLVLEYMHKCNLVYRDLKPENILIDETGYIRVADFGFSKLIENRTWTLCGTPEYLAPEIILSKGYNKSVDWWSFGVLIYEMNAGYSPFFNKNPMKMYEKITSGKYKCPKFFNDDLRDLISNMLQVDLSRRFGNLKDGPMDIKRHRWFHKTDWMKIYNKSLVPSYIPICGSKGDDTNFDEYEEEELRISDTDHFVKEFANF